LTSKISDDLFLDIDLFRLSFAFLYRISDIM